ARSQLQNYSQGLEIVFWSGLTIEELRSRTSRLTPESVVYFVMMVEDGAGRRFALTDSLDQITDASSVPVYTWYDGYLGHGVVGGKLASSENVANETAKVRFVSCVANARKQFPYVRQTRVGWQWTGGNCSTGIFSKTVYRLARKSCSV